jgi:signal transduction histidine kinase
VQPPVLRERVAAYVPFVAVALAGQLSAAWPPGPTDMRAFWLSTLLLVVCAVGVVHRRAALPPTFLIGASIYTASVALLMVSTGGVDSGLGVLLFMPLVGVALYGERWESAVVLVVVLAALLAVSVTSPHMAAAIPRRLFLIGSIGAMLSVAVHALRHRLVVANERTTRLLNQEAAINTAARQLTSLSEPSAITALGTQLATRIASPLGSEIRRASYLRIEDGMVSVDAQYDEFGLHIAESWPLEEHPGLRDAVATGRPVTAPLGPEMLGPVFGAVLAESGITHGAWVPVCPDGVLHGVLALSSRGAPLPAECVDRCIALGNFLELALANWAAHQKLEQQATAEERRRIARELHDGLAHELAFIASKTRGFTAACPATVDVRELAGAADRALDEARRAITVLSVSHPQSLHCAIAQTAEDLGSRLGVDVDLELAEDVVVPGEVTENLLRIVREAMTNAANHGASEQVKVTLECDGRVRLVIEDDGCGFVPGGAEVSGGFGLLSMEERAASVGAEFSLSSWPQRGTRVEVAFR